LPRPPTILEAIHRPIRGIQDQLFGGWARSSYQRVQEARPQAPGEKLVALAESLRLNTDGGALLRRLHPDRAKG
jgi:hypothetical protein